MNSDARSDLVVGLGQGTHSTNAPGRALAWRAEQASEEESSVLPGDVGCDAVCSVRDRMPTRSTSETNVERVGGGGNSPGSVLMDRNLKKIAWKKSSFDAYPLDYKPLAGAPCITVGRVQRLAILCVALMFSIGHTVSVTARSNSQENTSGLANRSESEQENAMLSRVPTDPPVGVLDQGLQWIGNVCEIELSEGDDILEGHGFCRIIEYEAPHDTTLFVSVMSEELDPLLRLQTLDQATLAEDDNSGGGHDAFLMRRGVLEGECLDIVVAASNRDLTGQVWLKVFEVRETEGTLDSERCVLEVFAGSRANHEAGKLEQSLRQLRELMEQLLRLDGRAESEVMASSMEAIGDLAYDLAEVRIARAAWTMHVEFCERTLPTNHPDLQAARSNLAMARSALWELHEARELQESVVSVYERTLSATHRHLQVARLNLAVTMSQLGELEAARGLFEAVVNVFGQILAPNHPDLQVARTNLAQTMRFLGELQQARKIEEDVLAIYERDLPVEDPRIQYARFNLAATMRRLGKLKRAQDLLEGVLGAFDEILPVAHPDRQEPRRALGLILYELGDLTQAKRLQEAVLVVYEDTMPADHFRLQEARSALATTLYDLGELNSARELEVAVLAARERTLEADHPDLQATRTNLAATMFRLGDLEAARELQVEVLAAREKTLGADHPDVQEARTNLAVTLAELGELEAAHELINKAVASLEWSLPLDHPKVQLARMNQAAFELEDLVGARDRLLAVVAMFEKTLRPDHPYLLRARFNLASKMGALGLRSQESELLNAVLGTYKRTLPEGPGRIRRAVSESLTRLGEIEKAQEQVEAFVRDSLVGLRSLALPSRALESHACSLHSNLSWALSFVESVNSKHLALQVFEAVETVRGIAMHERRLQTQLALPEPNARHRDDLRCEVARLGRLVSEQARHRGSKVSSTQAPSSDEKKSASEAWANGDDAFFDVLLRKEAKETELRKLVVDWAEPRGLVARSDAASIATALESHEAAIGFWRYWRRGIDLETFEISDGQWHYLAFVIVPGNGLQRVELGSADAIDQAVRDFRLALGVAICGARSPPELVAESHTLETAVLAGRAPTNAGVRPPARYAG